MSEIFNSYVDSGNENIDVSYLDYYFQNDFEGFMNNATIESISQYFENNKDNISVDEAEFNFENYVINHKYDQNLDMEKIFLIARELEKIDPDYQAILIQRYVIQAQSQIIRDNFNKEVQLSKAYKKGIETFIKKGNVESIENYLIKNIRDEDIAGLRYSIDTYIFNNTMKGYEYSGEEKEKIKVILKFIENKSFYYRGYNEFIKNEYE